MSSFGIDTVIWSGQRSGKLKMFFLTLKLKMLVTTFQVLKKIVFKTHVDSLIISESCIFFFEVEKTIFIIAWLTNYSFFVDLRRRLDRNWNFCTKGIQLKLWWFRKSVYNARKINPFIVNISTKYLRQYWIWGLWSFRCCWYAGGALTISNRIRSDVKSYY